MADESEIIAAYGAQNRDKIAAALGQAERPRERPAPKPTVEAYRTPGEIEAAELELTPPEDAPTRKSRQREHAEQARLFKEIDRAREAGRRGAALIFAIGNSNAAGKAVGAYRKAEGVRRGVPDLFCALPRHGRAGLFVEMKLPDGDPSDVSKDQREWLFALDAAGYDTEVCWGYRHALRTISEYLGWNEEGGDAAPG